MVDFKAPPKQNASGLGLDIPEINCVAENRDHQNSVDAITANPKTQGVYATGSHDKTIKIWDGNKQKCLKTMQGHANGVWCLNYFQDGKKLLSASSDGTSRIWDASSGKCTATLGAHTGRVYYAMPNREGTMAVSVGSDKLINVWDLRNAKQPVIQNADSQGVIMSCDFSNDGKYIISGTMDGIVNGLNLQTQHMDMAYDTLEFQPEDRPDVTSNMIYTVKTVYDHPIGGNKFIMGCELGFGTLLDFEPWREEPLQHLETFYKYVGHTNSVRKIEMSKDFSEVLTSSEDHQMIMWEAESARPKAMFVGHTDLVTGAVWIGPNTLVSSSWDCRILTWNYNKQ